MLPLEPMGVSLEIQPDVGPIIHEPIRSRADVDRLRLIDPDAEVGFVMDAIRLVRRELDGRTAVIGFSGSPFTLACYLIEGRPSRDYAIAKAFMYREPEAWHALMEKLSTVVIALPRRADRAPGVHVVQLFDSWVGGLSPADYVTYVQPHVRAHLRRGARRADHPLRHRHGLAAGGHGGGRRRPHRRRPPAARWTWPGSASAPSAASRATSTRPGVLAGCEPMADGARDILRRAANRPGHIFNLGHGVLPDSDPALLRRLVELVHEESAR